MCSPQSAVVTSGSLLPLAGQFDLAQLNLAVFARHTAKQSLKRFTQTTKKVNAHQHGAEAFGDRAG